MTHSQSRSPLIAIAILTLSLVAGMAAFAIAKKTGMLDPDIAKRGAAAMIGLVLVVTGNFVPKLRLFQPPDGAAGASAVDRFAGWTFVICGAAFVAVWLFAPIGKAMLASPLIGVGGFLVVLARWLAWSGRHTSSAMPALTPARVTIGLLLISILWTFGIFLADALWGDAASQWLAIIFPVFVGSALPFLIVVMRRTSGSGA